jgi:uncharacterized Zn finger protein
LGAKVEWTEKQDEVTVESIPQDSALNIEVPSKVTYTELSEENMQLQQQILLAVKQRQLENLKEVIEGYSQLVDKADMMNDQAVSLYLKEMSSALVGMKAGWDDGDITVYKQSWETYLDYAKQLESVFQANSGVE